MNPLKTKVIRTKDNNIYIFGYIHNSVYFCQAEKTGYSAPSAVIKDVWQCFSLCCNDSGIFLLCMGENGITLCFYDFEKWSYRKLAEKPVENCKQISILLYESTVRLVYFTSDTNKIFLTSADGSLPSLIAENVILKGGRAFHIGFENALYAKIFYMQNDKLMFKSLDIAKGSLSEENTFFTTNLPCTDYSILTAENEIHILWLAGNSQKSIAVYKNIIDGMPSKAKVIFENSPCTCCSLLKYKTEIFAQFFDRNKNYTLSLTGNTVTTSESSDCLFKAEYIDYSGTLPLTADEIVTEGFIYFPVSEIEKDFLPNSEN